MMHNSVTRLEITSPVSGCVEKAAVNNTISAFLAIGERGKLVMANPSVLIMDEPTRGIDVGSKFEIYVTMGELASQGTGVLFISSEIEELMGVCDRILVMSRGEMLNEFRREEFSQEDILRSA